MVRMYSFGRLRRCPDRLFPDLLGTQMSYCRFGDDDCDVYVYEGETCFVTHVATRRRKEECPVSLIDVLRKGKMKEWRQWHEARRGDEHFKPLESIHAGASFGHSTPEECAANLILLRGDGVRVPQHAIDTLIEESESGATERQASCR